MYGFKQVDGLSVLFRLYFAMCCLMFNFPS